MEVKLVKNQKGYTVIEGLALIFILSLVSIAGYYTYTRTQNDTVDYKNNTTSSEGGDIALLNERSLSGYEQCMAGDNEKVIYNSEMQCRTDTTLYYPDGTTIDITGSEENDFSELGIYLGRPLNELIRYQAPDSWQVKSCDERYVALAPVGYPNGICQSGAPVTIVLSSYDGVKLDSCEVLMAEYYNIDLCEDRKTTNFSYRYTYNEIKPGSDETFQLKDGGAYIGIIIFNERNTPIVSLSYTQDYSKPNLQNEFDAFLQSIEIL